MATESHTNPPAAQIDDVVSEAARAGDVVVIYADCEVEYDGRAAGYLGPGERVILCKPDGTLLVHRPRGHDPVNWQPPGSTFVVTVDDDACRLTARRSQPDEHVTLHLIEIYTVTRFSADDTAPLELTGTEADMHEYILEHPDVIEDGLRVLEHERDTPHGTIDVFATDETGTPVIIEVKRRRATLSHVDQLRRYMEKYRESNPEARGILVAPKASEKVERTLARHALEYVSIDEVTSTREDLASTTFDDFT